MKIYKGSFSVVYSIYANSEEDLQDRLEWMFSDMGSYGDIKISNESIDEVDEIARDEYFADQDYDERRLGL